MVATLPPALLTRPTPGPATGLGGIGLIALGFWLAVTHLVGDGLPTIVAFDGVGSLIAGIATGSLLALDDVRLRRDPPSCL